MPAIPFLNVDPSLLSSATSFLFVFAIVFGLLSFTKLFMPKDREGQPVGKEPRQVYAILALVFGVAAISYQPVVDFVQLLLPPATVLLVIVFFLVFVKEVFTKKREAGEKHPLQTLAILAIFLILLGTFWPDISALTGISMFISAENLFALMAVIIIVLIFYVVSRVEEKQK